MIIVTGYIQVAKENRAPALIAARMLQSHSRKEPGNITYEFSEEIDTPAKFRFYEEWHSPVALSVHLRADYTLEFRKAISTLGVVSIDVKRLDSEAGAVGDMATHADA
jgi:quinol monooxygenase YgiN